uniref:hypothetical protein n=1 Tax=uncultured Sulfitobacter sp. TaxID=191468 RepID=UPI0032B1CECC
ALEIFTEIWLPHNGLLASTLGKKASANLEAIKNGSFVSSFWITSFVMRSTSTNDTKFRDHLCLQAPIFST